MTRYSDEMPGEMKTKQNQENNETPKTKPPLYKAECFFFFFCRETNKQANKSSPKNRQSGRLKPCGAGREAARGSETSRDPEIGAQAPGSPSVSLARTPAQ